MKSVEKRPDSRLATILHSMSKRFFNVYQYLAPAVLTPLAYWLWLDAAHGDHRAALWMVTVPVLFAYIVPGVGTNVLRVWEINTRLRLGRFRPHHGFVFGSATACIAWLAQPAIEGQGVLAALRAGFVIGSVLAFWNWLYDVFALRAGFLCVYTRSYGDGRGAEAIAMDYAPPIFGLFGFGYGASAILGMAVRGEPGWSATYWIALAGSTTLCIALSVGGYIAWSYWLFGENGLKSYQRESEVSS
jgi:hypothetical protein